MMTAVALLSSHDVRQLDPSSAATTSVHIQRIPLLGSGPVAGWGWCWADASPGTVRVTCTTHGPAPWHAGHFPTTRQQVHHLHHPCTTYSVLIYRAHAVFIVFYINHVSGIIQYLAQVMAKRLWWYVRCKAAGCWAELQTLSSCSIWTWAWRGTPSLRHPGTSQSWTLQNINK